MASTWRQQQEIPAPPGAEAPASGGNGGGFGYAVAVSGNTAVVGAYHTRVGPHSLVEGAAYMFVRSGGVWTQQQKLTASDPATNDGFGNAVSVSGDTALIGRNTKQSVYTQMRAPRTCSFAAAEYGRSSKS